jgi:uncharacterized protein
VPRDERRPLGPEAVQRVAEATSDLDVGLLVAAAGFGSRVALLDADLGAETEMVDLNCTCGAGEAWHFGPPLQATRPGRRRVHELAAGLPGRSAGGQLRGHQGLCADLAEGLRVEWAPHGVDVIASAPGPIRSGFAERANMRMAQALPARWWHA